MRFRRPNLSKLFKTIGDLPFIAIPLGWSKTHSLPGFFGVPVYDVLVFLYRESTRVTLFSRANAMAFSFFLSLFPAIIFLFTIATMLPIYTAFEYEINSYIDLIMPSNAGKELQMAIKEMVKPNAGSLSIGFILALYFSSNGMQMMMEGFQKSHLKAFRKRGILKQRLVAIGLVIVMGLLLMSSVLLLITGDYVINWLASLLGFAGTGGATIKAIRWIVIVALFYLCIAVIYRYGAALHVKFKWITPGGTLATILCILISLAFSAYVGAFNTYNKIYGSIGTIIVLMLWIQLNCLILQIGFELNASIAVNRDLKSERTEEAADWAN